MELCALSQCKHSAPNALLCIHSHEMALCLLPAADSCGVFKIAQHPSGVTVHFSPNVPLSSEKTSIQHITARRICVAIPPVNCSEIEFSPSLPAHRQELMSCINLGGIIKIVVLYDYAFWREDDFSGEVVGDGRDGPVFNVFDYCAYQTDSSGAPTSSSLPGLVCFINGDL